MNQITNEEQIIKMTKLLMTINKSCIELVLNSDLPNIGSLSPQFDPILIDRITNSFKLRQSTTDRLTKEYGLNVTNLRRFYITYGKELSEEINHKIDKFFEATRFNLS